MRMFRRITVFSFLIGTLCTSQAALVVDWSAADYSGSNIQFILPSSTTTDDTRTWTYNFNTPLTPTSGYSGPPIYGVIQNYSAGGAANLGASRINTSSDLMEIWSNSTVAPSMPVRTVTAMIYFKLDLSPGETASFLEAESAITMSVNNPSAQSSLNKVAVLNDGVWYLSQTNTTTGLLDAALESWGVWNPAGAPLSAIPTTYDTLGSTFTNIQAIGFYSTATRGNSTAGPRINAAFFQANASVIPEPQSVCLLLLFLGVVLWRSKAAARKSRAIVQVF